MRVTSVCLIVGLLSACGPSISDSGSSGVELPPPGAATEATREANQSLAQRLPLDQPDDFDDAYRGWLASIQADAITNAEGGVVWPIRQFDFLQDDAPDTVNPSLWRQSKLSAHHGLFQVADGIWQVRGYDLSVMSIIEGKTGWIIIDPLTTTETAAAALKLVNDTLGERPVTGMLYTHSHADHFGGARGILSEDDIAARNIPVLAPVGFSKNAVSENLIAGNHMSRRSTLMFGNTLPRSPLGHVGSGLGPGLPNGTISLLLPTEEVGGRGTQRLIDGITFEFIDAAGTEAPAEFMFYLPEKRALCTAEVATATFHNVLTPRGAKVRDALAWSEAIDYVLEAYGARSDVVFASHHWPSWNADNVSTFLRTQRDIYRYVHDQTLRQANAGATITEAAEMVTEADFQEDAFDSRGYYGSLNHNSKAVFQYYFGWWSGNPSEYHKLPSSETAPRYVAAMGGADATLQLGQTAFAEGDYRWAAEILNHLVFADPKNTTARDWLAASYEQIGFQAESGAWRSYFLAGAAELRRGLPNIGNPSLGNAEFLRAVPSLDVFNAMAARFNPTKLARAPFTIVFDFTDTEETISLHVGPSVTVPRTSNHENPDARVTIARADLDRLILQEVSAPELLLNGYLKIDGDQSALVSWFATLDRPPFWFNIVTP